MSLQFAFRRCALLTVGLSLLMSGLVVAQRAPVQSRSARVAELITSLKSSNSTVREAAAKELGEMRAAQAIKPLIAALLDDDRSTCLAAYHSLINIGRPAVADLIGALTADVVVASYAASALGEIGDARSVQPLIAALKIGDARFAGKAMSAANISVWTNPRTFYIRRSAALSLGQLKDARAVPALIASLTDEDSGVRAAAARALGLIGDPRAIDPLITALQSKDRFTREGAVQGLRNMNDPKAAAALIAHCKLQPC